jgi:hypothetical protein
MVIPGRSRELNQTARAIIPQRISNDFIGTSD